MPWQDAFDLNPALVILTVAVVYAVVWWLRRFWKLLLVSAWLLASVSLLVTPSGREAITVAAARPVLAEKGACLGSAVTHGVPLGLRDLRTVDACRAVLAARPADSAVVLSKRNAAYLKEELRVAPASR